MPFRQAAVVNRGSLTLRTLRGLPPPRKLEIILTCLTRSLHPHNGTTFDSPADPKGPEIKIYVFLLSDAMLQAPLFRHSVSALSAHRYLWPKARPP